MPLKLHGKEYMTVAERINLLLSQKGVTRYYSLSTEIVEINDAYCVMKATLTFPDPYQYFTGHAMEEKGNKGVNKTSHVENCETSAIGRALAAAGFHGSEYASADELVEALNKQPNAQNKAVAGNGETTSSQSAPESTGGGVASTTGGFKGGDYDFLKRCAEEKGRIGEAQYRSILKEYDVEKANMIERGDKNTQTNVIKKLSTMKDVTHDMLFPVEVNYICSKSKSAMALIESSNDIDSYKSTDDRNEILDKLHIAYQSDIEKEKAALSEA